jgi:tetratricopeptide (TPR) repeat protein
MNLTKFDSIILEVSSDQKDISLPSSQGKNTPTMLLQCKLTPFMIEAFERTEEDHNSVISYAVNGDGYYRTITVQFKDARPQLTNEFIYEYGRSCPKYQCGDHSSCRKASSLTPTTTVSTPSVVQATVEVNEEQIDATASNEVSESHHDQKKIKKEFKGSPSNTAYESFMKERQNTVDELYERAQFSVMFPHLSPSLVATFLANFNYLDNDDEIYEIIGTGYYLVNSGDLSTAVTIFNTLIAAFYTDDEHLLTDKRFERFEADYPLITSYKMMKEHEKKKMVSYRKKDKGVLVKSLDGLANALAMLGYYDISIKVDNDLLKLIPDDHITILKRRGQVYSVLERHEEAIRDFTVIIDKLQESEALQSIIDRGKNYYSLHLPVAAYKDFSKAVSILRQSPDLITDSKVLSELWFRIGKCLKDFNDIPETIESYEKSLQYDSSNSQTYLELAGAALELSQWEKALDYIANLLKQDSKNTNAFGLRSLILYSLGMISRAYSDVKKGASLGMNDKFALQYAAYINLGFGNFKTAVDFYDKLLHSTPSSKIEAMREVAIFSFLYKDTPLREYSMDVEIDTIIRDATMKDSQESLELSDSYETDADDIYDMNLDRRVLKNLRDRLRQEKAFEAVRVTYAIADWMQIDSPGFLINYRQHVMFGLSVLQMAQTLLLHINIIKRGGIGLIVPDKASSKLKYYGMKHCAALDCQAKHHVCGWRDLLDIYVKWRQVSG